MGIIPVSDSGFLNKLAKECKDPWERDRLRAPYMLSIGYSVKDASRVFSVAEDAIYRWAQRWNEERSVDDRDRSGRPPALGEKEKKEIRRLLDENDPGRHGINSSTWTCTELRLYFRRRGIAVSEETIRRCLIDIGAHYVKAVLEYAEAYSREVAGERK